MPARERARSDSRATATPRSRVREDDGEPGRYFPPPGPDRLSPALSPSLGDPDEADRLRAAGTPRAATLTWERTVDAHLDAYERAAHRHARETTT